MKLTIPNLPEIVGSRLPLNVVVLLDGIEEYVQILYLTRGDIVIWIMNHSSHVHANERWHSRHLGDGSGAELSFVGKGYKNGGRDVI